MIVHWEQYPTLSRTRITQRAPFHSTCVPYPFSVRRRRCPDPNSWCEVPFRDTLPSPLSHWPFPLQHALAGDLRKAAMTSSKRWHFFPAFVIWTGLLGTHFESLCIVAHVGNTCSSSNLLHTHLYMCRSSYKKFTTTSHIVKFLFEMYRMYRLSLIYVIALFRFWIYFINYQYI